MAYDIETMVDILELYFNELPQRDGTPSEKFTKYEVTQMLNRAQRKACSLIHPNMLSAIETSDLNKALTGGTYAMSSLTSTPLLIPMGLIGVKITGGQFCDPISFDTYKQLSNDDKTWSASKPAFYVYAETINILPTTASNGDFYYLREAVDMDYDAGTDCELGDELQEILLDYASHIGYLFMKNDERAKAALDEAVMTINAINTRIDPEYAVLTASSREAYIDWSNLSQIKREQGDGREI